MIYKHESFGDTKFYSVSLNVDNKYCTIKAFEKIDGSVALASTEICNPQEALVFEKRLEQNGWVSTR